MPILWQNIVTAPNRWMAYWLRRRGWVCFYLEDAARHCGEIRLEAGREIITGTCWLQLYQDAERRGR